MVVEDWLKRLPRIRGDRLEQLPRLYSQPDLGGEIKMRPGDFRVEEVPLYELEGDGPHLYFEITKQNWTTDSARRAIARHMNVSPGQVGYAGRKDRDAVTVQRMSLEHADEDRLAEFDVEGIDLTILGLHRNKLKPGHLAGNRFRINVRNLEPAQVDWGEVVDRVAKNGVPNYFGTQRFGRRGDTAELGERLVTDRLDDFVRRYLGHPLEVDSEPVRRARHHFDNGELKQALKAWPDDENNRPRALKAYIKQPSPGPVLSEIPRHRRQLFVSAFQAKLFNEQVGARIDHLDTVFEGDIAKKQDTGGLFEVEDGPAERPRAKRGEIHPTGALPGTRTWQAEGKQGELETAVKNKYDVTAEDFERVAYLGASGTRRPLRIFPENLAVAPGEDEHGPYLDVQFRIRAGAYATMVLREIV